MKVFLSAGEPSGDVHGSNLIRAILSKQPNAQITALGGPLMGAAADFCPKDTRGQQLRASTPQRTNRIACMAFS